MRTKETVHRCVYAYTSMCMCVYVQAFECLSSGTKRPETRDIRLLLLQILEIASRRRPRLRDAARLYNGIFNIVPRDCPD